jgi:putative restriction endonuclease
MDQLIGTIAITDKGWYEFLFSHPKITDLNFWTPSAHRTFQAPEFSPFLFKLRAPDNAICGFAYFAQFSRLPDWLAWETFLEGNGCATFSEMRTRIETIRDRIRYKGVQSDTIGCIQLVSPTFFSRDDWIPQPRDWSPRTQTPVKYDLYAGEGRRVWEACIGNVSPTKPSETRTTGETEARYGPPILSRPRRGQPTFRIAVLEAYDRACAVTEEHSLPALEAAHIRPYGEDGLHQTSNGLLLRADLHRLFDRGYITITPDSRLLVGDRLRHDYRNGRTYYPLNGSTVRPPNNVRHAPDRELLKWHNETIFLG